MKAKTVHVGASAKAPTAFRGYLAALPAGQRAALERIRTVVHATLPGVEEGFGYGLPTFRLHGKALLHIGAAAKHCAIYGAVGDFAKDLAEFDVSKGTIRFQPEKPLPVALLKRLVLARAERISTTLPATRVTARRRPTAAS